MGLFKRLARWFFDDDPEAESPRTTPLAERTVLVIDDDPLFLDTVCRVLREAGFKVLKSNTGVKGLNMLRYGGSEIQLLLLDYHMPQFDGSATLQFARKLNPKVKVVALTGVDTRLLPASYREGVAAVIRKPCRGSELVEALQKVLEQPAPVSASIAVSAR